MTASDEQYFMLTVKAGLVSGPFLEIGSAVVNGNRNLCEMARDVGVKQTLGVDMEPGPGVDEVVDVSIARHSIRFSTVAIFNVLEHTYNPISVLENATRYLASGGNLMVLVPVIWPLHDFPRDYCRLNPHWFEEFAKQHGMVIHEDHFCWVCPWGIIPVRNLKSGAQYDYPTFRNSTPRYWRYWMSRIGHRLLNTWGRNHWAAHVALGVVMSKPS